MLINPSTGSRVVASIQEHTQTDTDRQTDNKTGTKHKTTNGQKTIGFRELRDGCVDLPFPVSPPVSQPVSQSVDSVVSEVL